MTTMHVITLQQDCDNLYTVVATFYQASFDFTVHVVTTLSQDHAQGCNNSQGCRDHS